jgi:hypothetical protein
VKIIVFVKLVNSEPKTVLTKTIFLFRIRLGLPSVPFVSDQNFVCISHLSHSCCMLLPYHNLLFNNPKQYLCRSQWPCDLRRGSWPVGCWDRGFESRSRHGCLSASFCVVLSCVGREALRRSDHSSKESYHMSK